MRLARPVRSTRRRVSVAGWAATLAAGAALVTAVPALAAIFDPPPVNVVIATDINSSFVGAEVPSANPAVVEVWRSNVRIAHTGSITPEPLQAGGFGIDVNHELGPITGCWQGTTPAITRGDSVRVLQDGNDYRSTVRFVSVEMPALDAVDNTVVHLDFRALDVDGTTALPIGEVETLIRNTSFLNQPRWLAPGSSPDHVGTVGDDPTEADPSFYRATYDFTSPAAATAAINADIVEASWLAGGEGTFAALGATPGPAPIDVGGNCPAPLATGPLGVGITKATDSGRSDTDAITADSTPTFTGLVAPNADVNLYFDVIPPATPTTVTADANGVFTFTPGSPIADGGHVLRTSEGTAGAVDEVFANIEYGFQIDATDPAAPTNLSTNPPSPSGITSPKVLGTAEAQSVVTVYLDENCAGAAAGVDTAGAFLVPGITISVASGQTVQIAAIATDVAGNTSACSNNIQYVADGTPPAVPTALTTTPATTALAPSTDTTPVVKGALTPFEADATIRVYVGTACTGPPAGTGTATAFTSGAGIGVGVAANGTSTIRASAVDPSGNVSGCSTAVSYFSDTTAPNAPTGLATTPPTTGNTRTPLLRGSTTGASTVRVYRTNDCTGTSASGTAAEFLSPGIAVPQVGAQTATFLSADALDVAGNVSNCATAISYIHDAIAPDPPVITGSDPAPPSTVNVPRIIGSASGDATTIRLYTNGTCAGAPVASGTVAAFATPGIQVSVTENLANSISARAVDDAGNASACSAQFVYVEDSTPPAGNPVILSGPSGAQKSRTANFTFQSVALDAGEVRECSLTTGADAFGQCDGPTSHSGIGLADGDYVFKVRVRDAQGNANTQTRTFRVDNIAPLVTIGQTPGETTRDTTPTFGFTADEPGVSFECAFAQGAAPVFAPCVSPFTGGPLGLGTWILSVRATDGAGNVGVPATFGFDLLRPLGAPSVVTRKAVAKKNGAFSVLVRCNGPAIATCSGVVEIVRRIPASGNKPARNVRIAQANLVLRAGQSRRVNLVLTPAARKLLAKSGKLSARALVTPTGGTASSFALTLTPTK